jgi:hypothetical protein
MLTQHSLPPLTSRHTTNLATQPLWSDTTRKALLLCGVISSVYYFAMNVYVTMQADAYSVASQVVSELSAIDAPTRMLWVLLGIPYALLMIAFGWGVWMSAAESRAWRFVGALFVVQGAIDPFWPPMHLRGVEPTLTDALHIAFAMAWLVVMLLAMGFAAASLGKRFHLYTLATLAVFVVFGTLTVMDGPRLAANLPTPWIGIWERINMGAGMLWIAVLAITLLRRPPMLAEKSP